MPRRAAALATPTTSTPLTDPIHNPQQDGPFAPEVSLLRRQWKWAAFSQFFYTFAALFAMPDVSLTDIEDDLTRSTSIVIHRVVHRLLVTATQDRKLSLENWQTALRKQYKKRDPDLNPMGPEPVVQLPTPEPDTPAAPDDDQIKAESSTPGSSWGHRLGNPHRADTAEMEDRESQHDQPGESSAEPKFAEMKVESMSTQGTPFNEPEEESKDWLSLPMLTRLDSLHLLTEWQFHNVNRLRTIMKDDDETAQWRIEPVGYDAKANAYWLIGPDRLWVQRAIPKPPRNLKRKRAPTKPKSKRVTALPDDESDTPPVPKKKRKAATAARSSTRVVTPKTPTRSARTRRPPSSPEELGPITSRGPRAAKTQASVKLSAQAKELAELQRQAALESRRSGRRVVSSSPSRTVSPRRPLGTRMSARLRGVTQVDDEWQEVPDDWLKDRDYGDEDGGASGIERLDGVAEVGQSSDPGPRPEPELEPLPDPDTDTQRTKTGLESDDDAVSELTELSEISPPATILASPSKTRKASKKSSGNRRKTSRSKHQVDESELMEQPLEEVGPEEEIEPEWRPPDDFVEWETICVTLDEWEHICERFEGATHYAEKALYKLLSQHIVPAIVAELREIRQKRHMEEAISQRKRSSRLALKENEKEEARLTALRKAEEEEKLSRMRRLEARQKREEEERLKREAAREKRRLDREERERKALAREEEGTNASSSVDVVGVDRLPRTKNPKGKPGRPRTKAAPPTASPSATASGTRTPVGEDWVLDCEICHRSGVNKDDGSPLLCCGKCSKWQHIACHDLADRQAGRPKRNWDTEEFICRACQGRIVANYRQVPNGSSYETGRTPSPYYHQTSGYAGQAPYGQQNYAPSHHARPPYPQHAAITFSHYQPQHRGFTTTTHSSPQMSQSHYPTHGPSPSKLITQYSTPPQYPQNIYSNGTTWAAPSSSSPAPSSASWSAQHVPSAQTTTTTTTTTTTGYPTILSSSPSFNSSAERSSMSGAGAAYASSVPPPPPLPAQNGNPATGAVTTAGMASTTAAMQQPQPWRGNPYVAPIGGGGAVSYYSSSPQPQPSPQHRAP